MERAWQITVNDKHIDVQDLPARVIADIAKRNDRSWFDVVATPLADVGVAADLVAAAATALGEQEPQDVSARDLVAMYEIVEREE